LALASACAQSKAGQAQGGAAAALTVARPEAQAASEWRPREDLGRALQALAFAKRGAEVNLSDTCVLRLGEQRFLVVVSDEGQEFGVVRLGGAQQGRLYDLADLGHAGLEAPLPEQGKKLEVDLEATASDGARLLLVGSASLKRKKPKENSGAKDLAEVVPASGPGRYFSDYVYELEAEEIGRAHV